nr:tape measure protein [Schaalia sp. lx-260]
MAEGKAQVDQAASAVQAASAKAQAASEREASAVEKVKQARERLNAATEAAAQKTRAYEAAAQSASSRVSAALAGEAAATDRVEVAKKKLDEAVRLYGADSKAALAASARFNSALAAQQSATARVTDAKAKLSASLDRVKNAGNGAQNEQKRLTQALGEAKKASEESAKAASELADAQKRASQVHPPSAWTSALHTLKSSADQAAQSLKQTLGDAFKSAGAAAGVGIAALGGFVASYAGEAIAASDATDKFKSTLTFAGLGSGQIEELTKSAQKYADQTVYDLADIQGITAQLAANSVPDFDKLAQAAGNLNAVAGGNKETFKSVGMVLTQTAGAGKLTGENWRQLSDAIPGASGKIKDALKEAGAYTGDFSKALSEGQVSAEEFNKAIVDLGFTDAATEAATSTSTFEGAWGNFEAAIVSGLKGIMEPIKGPITSALSTLADKFTASFEKIKNIVTGVTEIFTSGDFNPASWGEGIEEDSPIIDFLFTVKENLNSIIKGVQPVAGALAGMLGPLLTKLPLIGGAFSGLTGPVGLVIGLFTQMLTNSKDLRDAFGEAFSVVGSVFMQLSPIITEIMGILGPLLGQLGDILAPLIVTIANSVGQVLLTVLPQLLPIIQKIGDFISALMPVLEQIVTIISEQIQTLVPIIIPPIEQIITTIGMLIDAIAPFILLIVQQLTPIIQALMPIVTNVFTAIGTTISSVMTVIQGIINTVMALIKGDWDGVWEGIKQIFSGIWNGILGLIQSVWNAIKAVFNFGLTFVKTIWDGAWNAISNLFGNIWTGIKNAASKGVQWVIDTVTGVKDKITGFFSNAGKWLWDSGKKIIQGLIDGVKNMFNNAKQAVSDLLGGIRKLLPFSPAKEGPFSGKGWTLYSGRSIVEALAVGVRQKQDEFADAVKETVAAGAAEISALPDAAFGVDASMRSSDGAGPSDVMGVFALLVEQVQQLRAELPAVIEENTPVMSARDLARIR